MTLRKGGVLFVSNAHGFGVDKEGWTSGRTPHTRCYVCWLSEDTWIKTCETAGFELLEKFYRPPGKPREHKIIKYFIQKEIIKKNFIVYQCFLIQAVIYILVIL